MRVVLQGFCLEILDWKCSVSSLGLQKSLGEKWWCRLSLKAGKVPHLSSFYPGPLFNWWKFPRKRSPTLHNVSNSTDTRQYQTPFFPQVHAQKCPSKTFQFEQQRIIATRHWDRNIYIVSHTWEKFPFVGPSVDPRSLDLRKEIGTRSYSCRRCGWPEGSSLWATCILSVRHCACSPSDGKSSVPDTCNEPRFWFHSKLSSIFQGYIRQRFRIYQKHVHVLWPCLSWNSKTISLCHHKEQLLSF